MDAAQPSLLHHRFDAGMVFRCRDAASPAGTLVYIHGLGESGLGFEGLLGDPRLARFHHRAPDLPGYGKSPWTRQPLSLDDHADLLARWLITHDLPEPVVLLGHSMGGVIGTYVCERAPGRVHAFLDVEGNVSLADCNFSRRVAAYDLEHFRAEKLPEILDDLYRDGVADPALRTYYASVRLSDPGAYHRNSCELVEASEKEDLARRLAALGIPVLYVLGDPRGTGEHSRGLLDAAGVPWHGIADAGHWVFLDQPAAFVQVLLDFVGGLRGAGG